MSIKLVESLIKGLEILQVFSDNPNGLKLPEVTKLTGLPRATTYRFLQTLVAQNYLHYFPKSGTFRHGPRVMSLGFSTLIGLEIADLALPYLEDLSSRINQNVNLGILDGVDVVYLVRIKVRSILDINLTVGSRISAYNSAIGKALLANLNENDLEGFIDEISRDPEMTDKIGQGGEKLKSQLALIREQGYAMTNGEFIPGLASIAAPIYGIDGIAEAAVNVPVFTGFCSVELLTEVNLPSLLETAKIISQLRGCRTALELKKVRKTQNDDFSSARNHKNVGRKR
jgi:IclR family transcriptional regulator, pca regulon regulatory protein